MEEENLDGELDGKAKENFEGELEANTSAFEALERDFQEVLSDLMNDQSLDKFRGEYEKVLKALKKSHEQEKRLVKKCRELNAEILNNQAKIKTALRLSQEDQKTISHLQKEMEKTWKLVYMSQEKETRAKETIAQLKEEMTNLSRLVERGAGLSINQEAMVNELKQAKEELQRQVEELGVQSGQMERQLKEQFNVQEELRQERDLHLKLINDLKEKYAAKEAEHLREARRREKTQKELQDARTRMDDQAAGEEKLRAQMLEERLTATETDRKLADAKSTMEKYLRDYETLFARTTKLTEDLEEQVKRNKTLVTDRHAAEKESKLKLAEIGRLTSDLHLLERRVDKEHRAALHYQQVAEDAKTPLVVLQAEIDTLRKELLGAHKHENQLEKKAETAVKEKARQMQATQQAEQQARENVDLYKEQERISRGLGKEIEDMRVEIQHLRKVIYSLEKERERIGNELGDQKGYLSSAQEDIKLRDVQITELQKRIIEWEGKLKQQQHLYEQVRADRNHYSKALIESQDEVAEMRKKFKIMGHQIEQLKEEIAAKDQALVKEHFDYQRAEKLREHVQNELNAKNKLLVGNRELLLNQDNEIHRLAATIRKMDDEALAQRKEYDKVISERDIIGTQLIRRNDELALLYEKLHVQQSALKAGEIQYNARVDDLRLMKLKIKDLTRELSRNKGNNGQVDELKREVLTLQREILQEKTKVTALSEELENPMNVHRWRKLEGSDPATFELIQKVQTLQKRLISKTEEVVEKGLVIQEKDKLYMELKNILARQPGPEVAEQLSVYQTNLKTKTRQMKAMASELNMYQAQINEYKYEIERFSRELQDMKKKYYNSKRREQIENEMRQETVQDGRIMSKTMPQMLLNEQATKAKQSRTKFAGGGFAIK